jgi:hypothetical protein
VIDGVVTVKVPVAVWPELSVATTVVPEVPEGTGNVQEKAPVAPVVSEPLVHVEIATPSSTSEVSGVDTVNPVPATVTGAICGPCPGVTVIAGVVTVNTTTFDSEPFTVLFPVTLYGPEVETDGTVYVHRNSPLAFVVVLVPESGQPGPTAPLGTSTVEKVEFEKETLTSAEALKPVPLTVNDAPIGPCVGATMMAGPPAKGERWLREPGPGVEAEGVEPPVRTTEARRRLARTTNEVPRATAPIQEDGLLTGHGRTRPRCVINGDLRQINPTPPPGGEVLRTSARCR